MCWHDTYSVNLALLCAHVCSSELWPAAHVWLRGILAGREARSSPISRAPTTLATSKARHHLRSSDSRSSSSSRILLPQKQRHRPHNRFLHLILPHRRRPRPPNISLSFRFVCSSASVCNRWLFVILWFILIRIARLIMSSSGVTRISITIRHLFTTGLLSIFFQFPKFGLSKKISISWLHIVLLYKIMYEYTI